MIGRENLIKKGKSGTWQNITGCYQDNPWRDHRGKKEETHDLLTKDNKKDTVMVKRVRYVANLDEVKLC